MNYHTDSALQMEKNSFGYFIDANGMSANPPKEKPQPEQIEICEQWLRQFSKPRKTPSKHTSYSLKHRVEEWHNTYVTNGAFIQGSVNMGFRIKPLFPNGWLSPNVLLYATFLFPEENWKGVRPTQFSRWLFRFKTEDSDIGDLARDAIADPEWPRRATDFWAFYRTVREFHATQVLRQAWERSGRTLPKEEEENEFFEDEGIVHLLDQGFVQDANWWRNYYSKQRTRSRKPVSPRLRVRILERDKFRCVFCGKGPATHPGTTLEVDHVIPVSKGGQTIKENLQILCFECTRGKGDLIIERPA